jgi:hypothetical protein
MKARAFWCLALMLLATAAVRPAAQRAPASEALLSRATAYADDFFNRFSNVVVEETYVQEREWRRRTLKSDFLLVRLQSSDELFAFRDVFEVDGRPVRDRQDRLARLFFEPSKTAVTQAAAIAHEGARYSLADSERTINNPLLALGFLQSRYAKRFQFSVVKLDGEVGPNVWMVNYREVARPTLLRQRRPLSDGDMVAGGRLWIDAGSGRVLKTALSVLGSDEITTLFRFDDRFQVAVPIEMRERYVWGRVVVNGIATYGQLRHFEVHTEEKLQQ